MQYTFTKAERLCSKKLITDVFSTGNKVNVYPFKAVFKHIALPTKFRAQVVISVPKRMFKSAVIRNLIKRRFREAYRKNKHLLYAANESLNRQTAIIFIYIGKEPATLAEMESKLIISLQRIEKHVEQSN